MFLIASVKLIPMVASSAEERGKWREEMREEKKNNWE
jgi:hypothetical protein